MTRSRWLVVAALAAVVLVASLVPGGGGSFGSPFGFVAGDKWLHAVGYAVLAGAVTFADGRAVVGVLAAVAYGALVELLQLGVPYRSASALDAVANLVGAVVGAALLVAALGAYERYGGDAATRSTPDR